MSPDLRPDFTPASPFQYRYAGGWVYVKRDDGEYTRINETQVSKTEAIQLLKESFPTAFDGAILTTEMYQNLTAVSKDEGFRAAVELLVDELKRSPDLVAKHTRVDKSGRVWFRAHDSHSRGLMFLLPILEDRSPAMLEAFRTQFSSLASSVAEQVRDSSSPREAFVEFVVQLAEIDPATHLSYETLDSKGSAFISTRLAGEDVIAFFLPEVAFPIGEAVDDVLSRSSLLPDASGETVFTFVDETTLDLTTRLLERYQEAFPDGQTASFSDVLRAGVDAAVRTPTAFVRPPTGRATGPGTDLTPKAVRVSKETDQILAEQVKEGVWPSRSVAARTALYALLELGGLRDGSSLTDRRAYLEELETVAPRLGAQLRNATESS